MAFVARMGVSSPCREPIAGGEPLFDVQLLADREGVLHVALAAIRAERERFGELYVALRADPLLPTEFEGVAVAFPASRR